MGVRLARSHRNALGAGPDGAERRLPAGGDPPADGWEGESLRSADVRRKYGVNILSVHREGRYLVAPAPDMPFQTGDTLLVMGRREDVEKLRR